MSQDSSESKAFQDDNTDDSALDREIAAALGDQTLDELMDAEENAAEERKLDKAPGGLMRGKVVAINKSDIFVDTGGRSQGVITADQFDLDSLPNVGDVIEVMVDRYDGREGLLILTRKGATQKAAWATMKKGDVVEARVTGVNKGGLELDLQGIRAFMPASQIDTVRIEDISTMIGQKLTAKISELDRNDKNVVLSRRTLLEEEAKESREKTMAEIAEGQVRSGRVKTIMPYGAFVDIGGIDGLLHVSDMSYSRTADPNEAVKVGQEVQVKVLKIETGGKRISLGMKQLEANPWDSVAAEYSKGDTVKGKVTNLAKFGAFVEIEPGVEALIPISEMTWKHRVNHPSEIVSVGQEVEGSVIDVDAVRQRMSVSLKAVEGDPWLGIERRFGVGSIVPGKVVRVVDFGAFIELEPGIEGLAHISELSDKPIQRTSDACRPGQDVQARVVTVSESDRRIALSLKTGDEALDDAPTTESAKPKRKRSGPLKGGLE